MCIRDRDARQVEDLELAVGYYATHGKLASLVKGVAANALSPVAPAPQPEGRKAWAYKSAMLAAQTYLLAATAHGLATAPMEGFDAARLARPARGRLSSARALVAGVW